MKSRILCYDFKLEWKFQNRPGGTTCIVLSYDLQPSTNILTGLYIIKGFGDGEGNQRGKKREKKKMCGKYNFWQYQIIKTD